MPDLVVIGGGICGLQLAALFGADGREVVVLEKRPETGGRAWVWDKEGFTVDYGLHLVRYGPKSPIAKVFRHLGEQLEFVDVGESFVAFPDGQVHSFPTSPKGFLTTRLFSRRERLQGLKLIAKLRLAGLADSLPGAVHERLSKPRSLLGVEPLELLATDVRTWLDDNRVDGGLRQYFELVSTSMQVCPFIERASVGEMLLNIQSVLKKGHSVTYPALGWRHIFERLTAAIERRGEIRTGADVERVLIENGRARGVQLVSGETIEAEHVVAAVPSQGLHTIIDSASVPAATASLWAGQRPTAGIALDFGLKEQISTSTGLWYLSSPASFGLFTSNLCPAIAPAGKQLLTWLMPTEVDDVEDADRVGELQSSLEAALFRLFPRLEAAIQWRRAMHLPMADGVEINVQQHRGLRPGYRVPGIQRLFLVGDSTRGPGAGGDVGHESVLECYREITGREV